MMPTYHKDTLDSIPLQSLDGIGPRTAQRLEKLGIHSVQDILFHLPMRYQDRTRLTSIADLRHGDQAVVEGEVSDMEVRFGRRRSLLVSLEDDSATLVLRFFHFSETQKKALKTGTRIRCFGEVRQGPMCMEMVHPEYQPIHEQQDFGMEESLTPVYPTTEGIHQMAWRKLTDQALDILKRSSWGMSDLIPTEILDHLGLPGLSEAIQVLHRPPPDTSLTMLAEGDHPARKRLVFEELLTHQIGLRFSRERRRQHAAPKISNDSTLSKKLEASLPFQLTLAQQRVIGEIHQDLSQDHPMMRLVQGDVGSGKTLVAAAAALDVIESGFQVALMAPTELLAEQHYQNFRDWLAPLDISCTWLTAKLKGKKRQQVLEALESGSLSLIIGTHALFQSDVIFQSLGLVIVDEQHRFGVHQRMALRDKGATDRLPHQLIMTATPIPRTLAMSAYADLDLSVIDELPPGRTPVTTVVLPDSRRDDVMQRVRLACLKGSQAYWVCTLIDESEALQAQAAEDTQKLLQESLPDVRIALVHGRLNATDKMHIMASFKNGDIDLLVATTVVEVGVDVPNAGLMIIENPERLGLAQLHQLRGRVGRGKRESHCVLMYHPPLSPNAHQRLAVMRKTTDGFEIARKDLEIRGPGEVLGTRQTGEMQFRIADLMRDEELLPDVQHCAILMLKKYPDNARGLMRRWIGDNERYMDA